MTAKKSWHGCTDC